MGPKTFKSTNMMFELSKTVSTVVKQLSEKIL
eukprot:UN20220